LLFSQQLPGTYTGHTGWGYSLSSLLSWMGSSVHPCRCVHCGCKPQCQVMLVWEWTSLTLQQPVYWLFCVFSYEVLLHILKEQDHKSQVFLHW